MLKKTLLAASVIIGTISLAGCDANNTETQKQTPTPITYTEGVQYRVLEKPLQYKNNEITEFLWYGCPHCYAVNPIILQWEQDKKLTHTLVQKHSQLSERFMFDANVFYGLQLIDKTELRQEYFDKRQQGQFKSTKDINNWIQSKGINQDQFFNALKAPKLIAEREQTLKEERSTGSTGVPAFIVEGKYIVLVRGLSKIGGWKAVPGLINYLSALDGK